MGRKEYSMYENIGDLLKLITSSGVRVKTMIGLIDGPKTSGQLRNEIEVSSSTVIHAARDLEREKLLAEMEDGYHLTSVGRVISSRLYDMIRTMTVLEKSKDFWLTHDVGGIPKEFLDRINELEDMEIVRSTPTDVIKALSYYIKLVRNVKNLEGVSPIMHPDFPKIIERLVDRGATVKLVLTKEIFEMGKEKHSHLFKELINKENFEVWIYEKPIRVAFTVTEEFLSLALFHIDGNFDSNNDLISKNKGAINWGRELFKYYQKQSHRVREGT